MISLLQRANDRMSRVLCLKACRRRGTRCTRCTPAERCLRTAMFPRCRASSSSLSRGHPTGCTAPTFRSERGNRPRAADPSSLPVRYLGHVTVAGRKAHRSPRRMPHAFGHCAHGGYAPIRKRNRWLISKGPRPRPPDADSNEVRPICDRSRPSSRCYSGLSRYRTRRSAAEVKSPASRSVPNS